MKKNLSNFLAIAFAATSISLAAPAYGQTAAITNPDTRLTPSTYGSYPDMTTYGGTIGYTFSLSSNEILDDLGVYADGQTASQTVGIFSTTGTLLANASVDVTAAEAHTFVYSLSFTDDNGFNGVLDKNTDYIIGTQGTDYVDQNAFTTTASDVTLVAARYSNTTGSSLYFPDQTQHNGQAYVGPTFEFSPEPTVPEPSSWALMSLGAAVLYFAVRCGMRRNP